ncbi:MAG: hypothetical protein QG553_102 [Patescibacteria group bacterium]|nr:hypothetical protein [Patescibacteria group bacterium]
MVALKEVERQLDALGANNRFWGRAEIVELQHILVPGEQIQASLNGRYHGGFATFVVTDQRLLIVDKKLFYLTVEDMRYDMISEVDFSAQLLSGTIQVCTPTKTLSFTNYKPRELRVVTSYIQQKVMQVRHQYNQPEMLDQPQPPTVPAPTPQPVAKNPYATLLDLGGQAIGGVNAQAALPTPQRRNPYMNPPLMTRRRIGRFGPIASSTGQLSQTR